MLDNILPELIREILLRLSATHLRQLRRVCKAWRDMIDDPDFIRSHLHLQLRNSISDATGQLVFRAHGTDSLCYVSVASFIANTNSENKIKATPLHNINPLNDRFMEGGHYRQTSCNGVMFLSRVVGNTISSILWNPSTGESLELPTHTSTVIASLKYISMCMDVGFGYDYTHDDYKVVCITQSFSHLDSSFELESMVYSLNSDSWRRIKDFPYITIRNTHGAFLNGALHWIGCSSRATYDLIVGVDLGTEDYFEMPMPNNQIICRTTRTADPMQRSIQKSSMCISNCNIRKILNPSPRIRVQAVNHGLQLKTRV